MGIVVAARHLQLREVVALKFLHVEVAKKPALVIRFEREARAAVRIKSEHVARVLDVGSSTTAPRSSSWSCSRAPTSTASAPRAGRCRGARPRLRRAGLRGGGRGPRLRHRPPRPQAGQPLLDAPRRRLAAGEGARLRHLQDGRRVGRSRTVTTDVLGSPLYMSPEQIESPRDVDARADVWALGAILYKLLSGRAAFAAATVGSSLAKNRQRCAAAAAPAAAGRAARARGAGDALPRERPDPTGAERGRADAGAAALLRAGAARRHRGRLHLLAPGRAPAEDAAARGDGRGGRGDAGGRLPLRLARQLSRAVAAGAPLDGVASARPAATGAPSASAVPVAPVAVPVAVIAPAPSASASAAPASAKSAAPRSSSKPTIPGRPPSRGGPSDAFSDRL